MSIIRNLCRGLQKKIVDIFLRNLMPFFPFCLLKIVKLKPREILACQDREIKYARNYVRVT